MNWQEICDSPYFKDLPFKIELNHNEQIVMTPARNTHAVFQGEIIRQLIKFMSQSGKIFPECSIKTHDNIKVADVVWISTPRYQQVKHEVAYSIVPEICIEVLSPGNTQREMTKKQKLYFQAGAQEVWLCNENGQMRFYQSQGKLKHSLLVPDFPDYIGE